MSGFWKTLFDSASDNWPIFIAALIALIVFFLSGVLWWAVSKCCKNLKEKNLKKSTWFFSDKFIYYFLDIVYTLFVTTISLFPLLGMLGTVQALIELGGVFQTDGADMNGIKSEFFLALTSTAWGILFSVFFKGINAIAQPFFENAIAEAKILLNIGDKYEK